MLQSERIMPNNSPQTLKGFRDFLPEEKRQRDFVASKIVEIFERFGFAPVETPTLEYASLLLGKYGEEADKLVYTFRDQGGREIGLRYDQTVPTARVLSQYGSQLQRYFRRYQIQNVFRADKPQKGRFREFTQCDVDIFGSNSPLADAEILACTFFAFKNVGFEKVELRINDRQILFATLEPFATSEVSVLSIIQSVDKLDKLPAEAVVEELEKKGLSQENASKVLESINNSNISQNLKEIISNAVALGVPEKSLVFTPSLARGLDYYTGMIFEVIVPDYPVGSCGGGGRYDNLIGELGSTDIPAVGIAFGFDRIVEAARELRLIPESANTSQVLVTVFDKNLKSKSLELARALRKAKISSEVYPEIDKLAKQFKLANQKQIPFVAIIGEEEAKTNQVTLKDMASGEQELLSVEGIIEKLKI